MPEVIIDGKSYKVKEGKNLLETVLSLGFDLPYFCWHPAMGSVGSCRQCAVKKFKDEDDEQGMIVMSCMEPVEDGLRISIENDEAHDFRKNIIEWLMVNHPHDCPVCDEGGECHLQDMTVMAGHAYRRFRYKKRTYKNQNLGPCINHEMNRCIQCYRCVRFYQDYAGGKDLQVFASHDHVYFGRHEEGTLESEFSGNLVEVCPTGVFTDKTLKNHYTRKWDMTSAPSICQHCSLGCNIIASERYGGLRRVQSRYNSEVNGYFICDRGRFGYEFVNSEDRITKPLKNGKSVDDKSVIEDITDIITTGNNMAVGSLRASLEANYALQTLVGKDNFYLGVSGYTNKLNQKALKILSDGRVRTPSLKEIEHCDVVLIIGEDITNTAPMMDLAVKQSILQQPRKKADKLNIPQWNDSAVRELIQDDKGPLFILTPQKTKLDEYATEAFRLSPKEIARFTFALAHEVDNRLQDPEVFPSEWKSSIKKIVDALANAENPLLISGTSLAEESLLHASANLAHALHHSNENIGLSFVFNECNTLGASMLTDRSLSDAKERVKDYQNVIVLENDLYSFPDLTDQFDYVIVIDHLFHPLARKANFVLPAGTFAESEGTLVNNEGRAQRFFQVQASDDAIQPSWKWLQALGSFMNNEKIIEWSNIDEILKSFEEEYPRLKGVAEAAPSADHNVNNQKVARQSHRYSGRTAMHAQHQVNEPKPPEDKNSPLSFTMEGYHGKQADSSLTPFFWSPGWNSQQAINKFQIEIGGKLHQGSAGKRLLEPTNNNFEFFEATTSEKAGKWEVIRIHSIFGSEPLSYQAPAIRERSQGPYTILNPKDAHDLQLEVGQQVILISEDWSAELTLKTEPNWLRNTVGITYGFPETGTNIPKQVKIKAKINHGP
ncbi:MAG: NADH-quinone oxidoreductase subunit NuoG [Fulvivirga sp.]|nr:NADH-quinone oxidoreductase subunit NuoG [Fulvivirga sp.]